MDKNPLELLGLNSWFIDRFGSQMVAKVTRAIYITLNTELHPDKRKSLDFETLNKLKKEGVDSVISELNSAYTEIIKWNNIQTYILEILAQAKKGKNALIKKLEEEVKNLRRQILIDRRKYSWAMFEYYDKLLDDSDVTTIFNIEKRNKDNPIYVIATHLPWWNNKWLTVKHNIELPPSAEVFIKDGKVYFNNIKLVDQNWKVDSVLQEEQEVKSWVIIWSINIDKLHKAWLGIHTLYSRIVKMLYWDSKDLKQIESRFKHYTTSTEIEETAFRMIIPYMSPEIKPGNYLVIMQKFAWTKKFSIVWRINKEDYSLERQRAYSNRINRKKK